MGPYDALKMMGAPLGAKQSVASQLCPFCHGGRGVEKSLSLTRDGGSLLFLCHRATCGRKGRVWLGGTPPTHGVEPPIKAPKVYTGELRNLNENEHTTLWSKYQLGYPDVRRAGLQIDTGTGRLVCPIRDAGGRLRGYELRRITDGGGPKTLHFRHVPGDNWLGWFFPDQKGGNVCCIVEDVLSAIKVSRQYPAVALLGSHITSSFLAEIFTVGGSHRIVLALDKDATEKAYEFKKKFQYWYPQLQVIALTKDLKYEPDDRIRELLAN